MFTGLSREPTFVAELTSGEIVPRYDVMHQASVDVQWSVAGVVLKGETFLRTWSPAMRWFMGGGVGVERTIHGIVSVADLTIIGELLFDTRPLGAPLTFFDHDGFVGFRLAFHDRANTDVTGGAIVDIVDGTTLGRLELSRGFGDHWKAVLGVHVVRASARKLEGAFRHDDYLQLRVANHF